MSNSYATDDSTLPAAPAAAASPEESVFVRDGRHRFERDIKRCLLSSPGLRFSSLVVRRIENGVCLEGVLETEDERPDICGLVQQVAGVQHVLNHLVHRRPSQAPVKG